MYAQLGNIRFEGLKGFSSFEQSFGVNYAQHELINRKPKLEATGENLDTINFDMYLHSDFTDPEADILLIRNAITNREVMTLILGNGTVVGDFVIPSASVSTNFTDPNGNLIECTISVELLESFNEDRLKESKKQASKNAFATTARDSNVRSVMSPKISPAGTVSTNVAKLQASDVKIRQYAAASKADPETVGFFSVKTVNSLDDMEKGITDINSALETMPDLVGLSPDIVPALESVYTEIQNIRGVLPITDVDSFILFAQQLSISVQAVKDACVIIFNESIIRRR